MSLRTQSTWVFSMRMLVMSEPNAAHPIEHTRLLRRSSGAIGYCVPKAEYSLPYTAWDALVLAGFIRQVMTYTSSRDASCFIKWRLFLRRRMEDTSSVGNDF
jgi:hypothetical protein